MKTKIYKLEVTEQLSGPPPKNYRAGKVNYYYNKELGIVLRQLKDSYFYSMLNKNDSPDKINELEKIIKSKSKKCKKIILSIEKHRFEKLIEEFEQVEKYKKDLDSKQQRLYKKCKITLR